VNTAAEDREIGIIGGGVMGLTLAYYLSQEGHRVSLFERGGKLGGLAGSLNFDGCTIDKYYHSILSGDRHLLQLIHELDLDHLLRFRELRMGFYHESKLHPMSTPRELLTFPPLNMIDRGRLVFTVLYSLFVRNWENLESVSVEKWLSGLGGRRNYENIWKPLLRAKFDGNFGNIPATYIWSRIHRMNSVRKGDHGKGDNGCLVGGFQPLIDALQGRITDGNGTIFLNSPVEKIEVRNGGLALHTKERSWRFDKVISTVPTPYFQDLLPEEFHRYRATLSHMPYLDIVCLLLILKKSLSPYHTLNITDTKIPFTGVIETTNLIDPQYVKGRSLVYFPIYLSPGKEFFHSSEHSVYEYCRPHIEVMFPHFRESDIVRAFVMRSRFVEPIHKVNATREIPDVRTPVPNLFLANTTQVYPDLLNCESIVRFARKTLGQIHAQEYQRG